MEQITSRQNTLLTRLVRLQNSKKYRQEQGLFVGDGTKLLEEAIRWAPEQLRAVVLQEGVECPQLPGACARGTGTPAAHGTDFSNGGTGGGAVSGRTAGEKRSSGDSRLSGAGRPFRIPATLEPFCGQRMRWTCR